MQPTPYLDELCSLLNMGLSVFSADRFPELQSIDGNVYRVADVGECAVTCRRAPASPRFGTLEALDAWCAMHLVEPLAIRAEWRAFAEDGRLPFRHFPHDRYETWLASWECTTA